METNDSLIHYGVLGMKWGVRKQRKTSSKPRKKKTSIFSKKKETQKKEKTKKTNNNLKKMSDAELRAKIVRLQLEKQYKDLSRQTMSDGHRIVNDIIKNSARNIGTQALTKYGLLFIDNAYAKHNKKKSA